MLEYPGLAQLVLLPTDIASDTHSVAVNVLLWAGTPVAVDDRVGRAIRWVPKPTGDT
jgi:hypothetical protein